MMSSLSFTDRETLEKLFDMRNNGNVLDLSRQSFSTFFLSDVRIDIEAFCEERMSRANMLRKFWENAAGNLVGKAIDGLASLAETQGRDASLIVRARSISARLLSINEMAELDALEIDFNDELLERIARPVRELIVDRRSDEAVDRMHTYMEASLRRVCLDRGVSLPKKKPLWAMFAEYRQMLVSNSELETDMAALILESVESTLKAFSSIRNNQSMAHANTLVGLDEAEYILTHVLATLKFVRAIEQRRREL